MTQSEKVKLIAGILIRLLPKIRADQAIQIAYSIVDTLEKTNE